MDVNVLLLSVYVMWCSDASETRLFIAGVDLYAFVFISMCGLYTFVFIAVLMSIVGIC